MFNSDVEIYYMNDEKQSDLDRLAHATGLTPTEVRRNKQLWNIRDMTGFYYKNFLSRPGYFPGLVSLLGKHGVVCQNKG